METLKDKTVGIPLSFTAKVIPIGSGSHGIVVPNKLFSSLVLKDYDILSVIITKTGLSAAANKGRSDHMRKVNEKKKSNNDSQEKGKSEEKSENTPVQ